MKSSTKSMAASVSSFAAVGAIAVGAFFFAGQVSAATPEPTPAVVEPASFVDIDAPAVEPLSAEDEKIAVDAEAARVERERIAAEKAEAARVAAEAAAAEAARVEAERIAAEQAAADEAARNAYVAPAETSTAPAAPVAPVVEPAAPAEPGGNQQVGECREYNDANECTAWYEG